MVIRVLVVVQARAKAVQVRTDHFRRKSVWIPVWQLGPQELHAGDRDVEVVVSSRFWEMVGKELAEQFKGG